MNKKHSKTIFIAIWLLVSVFSIACAIVISSNMFPDDLDEIGPEYYSIDISYEDQPVYTAEGPAVRSVIDLLKEHIKLTGNPFAILSTRYTYRPVKEKLGDKTVETYYATQKLRVDFRLIKKRERNTHGRPMAYAQNHKTGMLFHFYKKTQVYNCRIDAYELFRKLISIKGIKERFYKEPE